MAYQSTFKRYEIKFLMTQQQKQAILQTMQPYMRLDRYGRTTIRNIYFDTDNYRLIRRSLEKPIYKEKLRVRSYKMAAPNDDVFVELKKKYEKVVYKRRQILSQEQAMKSFRQGIPLPVCSQIADEIEYFRSYYEGIHPTVFLSYEREAFYALDGSDFRITFDENILYRDYDLSLRSNVYGIPLLNNNESLMEIKTTGGIPLWMSQELSRLKIFNTSFSKYGLAYQDMMMKAYNNKQRRILYAC